jgi:REG-2-like HAD superfamily hydrolase
MRVQVTTSWLQRCSSARRCVATSAHGASPHWPAVSLDAYGCVLHLAEPVEDVYLRAAERHGIRGLTREGVKTSWRAAFAEPVPPGRLRYEGDGSAFWRRVVAASTGSSSEELYTELFAHYGKPESWTVAPGARDCLRQVRECGTKLALLSNFDNRLRALLHELELAALFDELVISAEVGWEKPHPSIFLHAAAALGVPASDMLHVGDDPVLDVQGALAAGYADAWLYGRKAVDGLSSFEALQERLMHGKRMHV